MAVEQWALQGYAPLREIHHLGAVAPDLDDAEADSIWLLAPVLSKKAKAKPPRPKGKPTSSRDFDIGNSEDVPFVISWDEQRKDAYCRLLHRVLTHPKKPPSASTAAQWEWHEGKLWHLAVDALGNPKRQLVVPAAKRSALMAFFHYANHRGHEPLKDQLRSFWWPNMDADCLDFVRTCTVCGQRASRPLQRAVHGTVPTPSTPFSVIHVDHKGPLPSKRSDKYNNILVVTCALTRFTLLIPVTSTTAEETLRALVARVFCVFGHPAVIVSDNGPAFCSGLSDAAANFFGYRHIHILPYNAQANGVAEASVKRIKLLLDRHTSGYADWHKPLPLLQSMLNTTTHTSTGVSPYVALFGREPIGIEHLENPSLYPTPTDGMEFLSELRPRLLKMHAELQAASDAIKQARIGEANSREHSHTATSRFGTILPSTSTQAHYAWLLHGSAQQAEYIRKHGHGLPWKYKYKVLEVRPYAVRLEVPSDGSVPRVSEWQLIRRLAPAAADEHEPPKDWAALTESGIRISAPASPRPHSGTDPMANDGGGGDAAWTGDDDWYELEGAPHAERVGGYYKVWLKWKDYEPLTWRWHHELRKDGLGEQSTAWVEAAVEAARQRYKMERGRPLDAEIEDEFEPAAPPPAEEQRDEPQLGRGARVRTAPDRYAMPVLAVNLKPLRPRHRIAAAFHLAMTPLMPERRE